MAADNPPGCRRRGKGELIKLCHRIAASTVWQTLHGPGINPASNQVPDQGPCWPVHRLFRRRLRVGYQQDSSHLTVGAQSERRLRTRDRRPTPRALRPAADPQRHHLRHVVTDPQAYNTARRHPPLASSPLVRQPRGQHRSASPTTGSAENMSSAGSRTVPDRRLTAHDSQREGQGQRPNRVFDSDMG